MTATAPTSTTAGTQLSPADVAAIHCRTLRVVAAAQVLGGAGLAAGVTVGALLAERMLGSDGVAGIPTALFTLGSALTAFTVGRVINRRGRRIGLAIGFGLGSLGAIGVVIASRVDSVWLLLVSLFVYGAGTATNLQTRYAGTDLAPVDQRARAISIALVSTTLGAVAGPNLVTPLGDLAESWGFPDLAGPFMLAAVAYLAAGTVLFVALRPDPYLTAVRLAADDTTSVDVDEEPTVGVGAIVGGAVMVITQMAMVAIMTMTPPHMREHDHDLGEVGLVISLHIAAMYLPSLVTGRLVDRIGRTPMVIAAGVTLLGAGVVAALSPVDSVPALVIGLVLLGLGWNFGLIAGTALVVDATVPSNRPRVQGTLDVLIALSGAGSGAAAGVVTAQTSYATLSLIGGTLSLVLIPVMLWYRRADGALANR